jgi:hypothetical protein
MATRHHVPAIRSPAVAAALLTLAIGVLSSETGRNPARDPPSADSSAYTVFDRYPLAQTHAVEDIRWSPDGKKMAVAREDGQVLLLPDEVTLWTGNRESLGYPTRLWWSPDGRQLAVLRQEVLELLTLETRQRRVIGDCVFSVAWLPSPRRETPAPHSGELICLKRSSADNGEVIVARVSGSRGSRRAIFEPIPVSTGIEPTALSPDGNAMIAGLPIKGVYYVHGLLSVGQPPLPGGTVQWTRQVDFYWEYPAYARAVWSEAMQAVAVSCAGATDGASFRGLTVVTRERELEYRPPQDPTPADLHSDPVWLDDQVIFAEGGCDTTDGADRECSNVLSSFQVPSGRRRVLFSGADDYRAPAVSPDGRKLAFAEKRAGRWEVVVATVYRNTPRRLALSHRADGAKWDTSGL